MSSKSIYITQPYFYIIRHIASGKKYAGAKWGIGCMPSELLKENGYTTSSNIINAMIREEGLNSFEVLQILEFNDAKTTYEYETNFLKQHNCAHSEDWFNYHNNDFNFIPYLLENYGVTNPMQIDEVKKLQKEVERKTLLKRYGVTCNLAIPEVIEQIKQHYKDNPQKAKERAIKIARSKEINGTTGRGTPRPHYTNNGKTGKWLRTDTHNNDISERQKVHSHFIKDNPMTDPEKRKKVSQSKIGKKKFIHQETNEIKMFLPGTESIGFILASKKKA